VKATSLSMATITYACGRPGRDFSAHFSDPRAESRLELRILCQLLRRWSGQQISAFSGSIDFKVPSGERSLWLQKVWLKKNLKRKSGISEENWSRKHLYFPEILSDIFGAMQTCCYQRNATLEGVKSPGPARNNRFALATSPFVLQRIIQSNWAHVWEW